MPRRARHMSGGLINTKESTRKMRKWLVAASFFVFAATPALAQDPAAPRSDWRVVLGGAGFFVPSYEGSDRLKARALPIVDIEWRETVFLDTRRGLGANALTLRDPNGRGALRVGPLLSWRFARDEDDDSDLRGLGNVKDGVDLGGFASYEFGSFALGLVGKKNVSHTELGSTVEVSGRYRHRLAGGTMLAVGPSATWADSDYMRTYFGVTAAQSRASGLATASPSAGFKDVGLSGSAVHPLGKGWSLVGTAGYARLIGDAADSSLVKTRGSADQTRVGLGVSYRLF